MNTPNLISWSVTKDCLILTYLLNDKEINAMVEPYTVSTYLVDLEIANDRAVIFGKLAINYRNTWMEWKQFIVEARVILDYRMEDILKRHVQTELIKSAFRTHGNCNYSFN